MIIWSIFGTITPPGTSINSGGYIKYGMLSSGLAKFLSNILIFLSVVAGLFTLVNLVLASYSYLSSNNEPQKIAAAGNKILQSLIGLAIIAAAFIIAGIIGKIFFNDTTFLFNPKFTSLF